MAVNYQDWMRQAQRDLDLARKALEAGSYEWACFAAQQSAEKGVKAVFLKASCSAWGHSVSALLQQLPPPFQAGESLIKGGKELDKHYIPARYTHAFPQGAPCDYYTAEEAQRAITIHSTSSPSVKLFWLNLDEVKGGLIIAARKLAKRHAEIDEVWLFGSLARGQAVPGSDADVFLVLQDCDLPFLDRAAHYQPEFCGLGVDLFAYTRKELEQMERAGHRFLERVKAERVYLFRRQKG